MIDLKAWSQEFKEMTAALRAADEKGDTSEKFFKEWWRWMSYLNKRDPRRSPLDPFPVKWPEIK